MNGRLGTRWVVCLVLALAIALGAGGEGAQTMAPLSTPAISFGPAIAVGNAPEPVSALAAADVDGDGDLDLVATAGKLRAWENGGAPLSGSWTAHEFGSGVTEIVTALAAGDVDHDGDIDLVTIGDSTSSYTVELWENDGTPFDGDWIPVTLGSLGAAVYAVAMGDLDNDGDLDAITGEWDAVVRIWENDDSPFAGTWVDCVVGTAPTANEVGALAVGDLDNDGDLDVVSGDWSNQVTAWRNNGDPFARAWDVQPVGTAADEVASLALADLGGDGDLDVVAGYGPAETSELIAWQNDGTPFAGTWVRQEIGSLDVATATGVALGDLDVDGDPDLVSGSSVRSVGVEVMSWANDAGTWTGADVGEMGEDVASLLVADLDQDGDPDVVAAGSAIVAWPNAHTPQVVGGWVEGVQPLPAYAALSVAAADVDHDGALDIATGTQAAGLLAWLGDGGYSWTRIGSSDLPDAGTWPAVAWGQIDNRAELDLAAASDGGLMAWVVEEGGTHWEKANEGLPEDGTYQDVVLAHVDHDGQIDLVACGSEGIEVYAGDRDGSGLPIWRHVLTLGDPTVFCEDVAVGDVDHDGALDIAGVYDEETTAGVWLGGGDMNFAAAPAPPVPVGYYRAVAMGDLDHDGDDDLVASLAAGGVRVWMVDREPRWTETATIGASIKVTSLDLGDVDHDGDLDILAGVDGGVHVWLGDGGATWTAASSGLPTMGGFFGAVLGRVDGDAALDVIAADWSAGGVRIWTAAEPPPGGWRNFAPETHPPYVWERRSSRPPASRWRTSARGWTSRAPSTATRPTAARARVGFGSPPRARAAAGRRTMRRSRQSAYRSTRTRQTRT
ncbi:MAG: VCBS repeat-containing protein [Anaerolineae bacterium]|nr:VCBS repeat-containing protein [Anaerolineae bacterium]